MERNIDIREYLEFKNILTWAKPTGKDLFNRLSTLPAWVNKQRKR